MTEVLGVSATISGAIAIVRSYVLQFAGDLPEASLPIRLVLLPL